MGNTTRANPKRKFCARVDPNNPPWPAYRGYDARSTGKNSPPPGKDFMNAPWLFAEAYEYRRLSKFWSDYDVFYRQKCHTFSRSSEAVFELSMRFTELCKISDSLSANEKIEAERLMFLELTQIASAFHPTILIPMVVAKSVFGETSTDLSLLINMTEEQIKSLQSTGGDHLAATEGNILGNHINGLWETVKSLHGRTGGRVDFVLDIAEFELYCDIASTACTFNPIVT